jgi:hypothetical protein
VRWYRVFSIRVLLLARNCGDRWEAYDDVLVRLAPRGRGRWLYISFDSIPGIRWGLVSGTLRCARCEVQDGTPFSLREKNGMPNANG